MGKWGISGKTNTKKCSISRKKHVIDLKTRKEPKINMFDFEAFQEKMHMLSREKYPLQMLFGAFQDTSRTIITTHPILSLFKIIHNLRSPFGEKHLVNLIIFTPSLKFSASKITTFSIFNMFDIFWFIKNFFVIKIIFFDRLFICFINWVII